MRDLKSEVAALAFEIYNGYGASLNGLEIGTHVDRDNQLMRTPPVDRKRPDHGPIRSWTSGINCKAPLTVAIISKMK